MWAKRQRTVSVTSGKKICAFFTGRTLRRKRGFGLLRAVFPPRCPYGPRAAAEGGRHSKAESGFTLLELMVTLVVVSIGFGVILATFFFSPPPLPKAGETVVREAGAVRSSAMLSRTPATLRFVDEPQATVLLADGVNRSLPAGVHLVAVNGKPAREAELVFHPFGLVPETLLHFEFSRSGLSPERLTVFFPGAEAAFFLPGFQDRVTMTRSLVE